MIKRIWRLFIVGSGFAVFGISSLFTVIFIMPILRLLPFDRMSKTKFVQWIINKYFHVMIRLLVLLGFIKLEVRDPELFKTCGNSVIIANHPSYLDVVILLSLLPRASCIVKKSLLRNPLIGGIIREANYVGNDSEPEKLIDNCVAVLKQGVPLIIFPEGTRSSFDGPLIFHRGSGHIAIKGNFDILPVIIQCDPPFLSKGMPWYRISEQPSKFIIHVRPLIRISDIINSAEPASISSRKLMRFIELYFREKIGIP